MSSNRSRILRTAAEVSVELSDEGSGEFWAAEVADDVEAVPLRAGAASKEIALALVIRNMQIALE